MLVNRETLAYETLTHFEEWMLRHLKDDATNRQNLKARNAAEDLINSEPDWYANMDSATLYSKACEIAKVIPYSR